MGSDGRQELNISPGGIELQISQANLVIIGVSTFRAEFKIQGVVNYNVYHNSAFYNCVNVSALLPGTRSIETEESSERLGQ